MALLQGDKIAVGFAKEATRGTENETAGDMFWLITTENPNIEPKKEETMLEDIQGTTVDAAGFVIDREVYENTVPVRTTVRSLPIVLRSILSNYKKTSVQGQGGAIDHRFRVNNNDTQPPSYTMGYAQTGFTPDDYAFLMTVVNKISMTFPNAGTPMTSFDTLSREMVKKTGAKYSPEYHTDDISFQHSMAELRIADNLTKLDDDSSILPFNEASLEIMNNAQGRPTANDTKFRDIVSLLKSATMSITLDKMSNDWWDFVHNGGYKAVRITLTDTRTTIGTNTHNSITITAPRVGLMTRPETRPRAEIVTEQLDFKCYQDNTTPSAGEANRFLEVVVRNEITADY